MSRKQAGRTGFRVVVHPRRLGDYGAVSVPDSFFRSDQRQIEREYQERCEEIAAQVKRHADNVGCVEVEWDTEYACEHCGSQWTEDSNEYNGGCCDKDQEQEDAREHHQEAAT